MKKPSGLIALFAVCMGLFTAQAATTVYQASVGGRQGWLTVPKGPARALFFTHRNMTEEALLRHPEFVKACEKLSIACLYVAEGDYMWKVDAPTGGDKKGRMPTQEVFQGMLDALAQVSQHTELKTVPVIPFGHSAQATFPWNFAAWNAERTLCIISYHGDAPRTNLTGYGRENVEWGRTRNIDGIPALMIEGEYEWWESRVRPALAFRMMYPESCISFLCDAGRGHFDLADATVQYIVRFIEKSLEKRPNMEKIDPTTGYLAARWSPDPTVERPQPAPFGAYAGDPHDAFWYFDREMASLTEARYAETKGKKMQYLGFRHGGKTLPYDPKRHVKTHALLVLEADDTFTVEAFFTDESHEKASEAHAATRPIVRWISGPAIELGNGRFRLDRSRLGTNESSQPRWGGITLCAEALGDGEYKSAVAELNLKIPGPMIGSPFLSDEKE